MPLVIGTNQTLSQWSATGADDRWYVVDSQGLDNCTIPYQWPQTTADWQISNQTAATSITAYRQLLPQAYTGTAASTVWLDVGLDVGYRAPTEQQQRRWRREKLEVLRASKRARKTLIKFLDDGQLASYAATRRFKVVASNGWVFELGKGRNALLLGDDGHADASFCIHPRVKFPDEDVILSLMLLLMSDVEEFLRIANRTTIRQRPLAPVPPQPAAHEGLVVVGQAA